MKNIRKISALLVALAVMASLCVPALAVPTTQEVNDIVFYDSFENRTVGAGAHNASLEAGANGWYLWSQSRSYVTYSEVNGEVVSEIDIDQAEKATETFAYTLKNGDAFEGKIALETKLMPTTDEEFEIRLVNRNLKTEGGTDYNAGDSVSTNHMVYGVLRFTNGTFRYTNVTSEPQEAGGYANVTELSQNIPALVNEWMTLRYEIDTENETYSVYANGTEVFKNAPMYIKNVAEDDRTFAQNVTNLGYMTFRKSSAHPLYLYVDDIAVYDLASTTKYYWSDEITVPEYSFDVDADLCDAKIEVPLVDASGAATTQTVKTPVRLAKLDSSKAGVQLTTVEGLQDDVVVTFNKKVVVSPADVYEEKNFNGWVNGVGNAKTETEGDNKFLRVTADGTTSYANVFNDTTKVRFADAETLEVSFKIRFSGDCSSMTSYGDSFMIQFIEQNVAGIPSLAFMPGTEYMRYNKDKVTDSKGNAVYGSVGWQYAWGAPDMRQKSDTDTTWHTVKLVYENDKMKLYVDDVQCTFNGHYISDSEYVNLTEAPIADNFALSRFRFKFASENQKTAIVDLDDLIIEKKEVKGNATLASIDEQEWTTAKGAVTLPTQVKGTLSDGSDAYYDIISLTPTDAPATDVGEYTYTATVAGYDSPVTVKVNVVENEYTVATPTATEVTVTKNVSHDAPAKLFVAIFRNERLVDVQQTAISATDSYTIDMESESGDVVKAFVWGVNGMKPLALSREATIAE